MNLGSRIAIGFFLLFAIFLGACTDNAASITGGQGPAGNNADNPRMAMNVLGYAFVVWEQESSRGTDIASNSYVPFAGFGAVEYLTSSGSCRGCDVAMNRYSENAVAVWTEEDRNGGWGVYASRLDGATKQWGSAVPIVSYTEREGNVHTPRVAMDGDGNATAVWTYHWVEPGEPAHYAIYTSDSLTADGGSNWSTPIRLDRAVEEGL
ncbi:MAG: hypothetical protein ACYSUN_09880, partial [Planctomycetota bacterium]